MGTTPPLPGPLRAALGLLATVADEAKNFPDRAVELPMLAVSTALQVSLRAQQRYAQLTARGDELLGSGAVTDEPPPWATFDEPLAPSEATDDDLDLEPETVDVDLDLIPTDAASQPPAKPARRPRTPRTTTPAKRAEKAPTTAAKSAATAPTTVSGRRKPSKFDVVGDE